jgi:beta-barrel assembly-enhancing protease
MLEPTLVTRRGMMARAAGLLGASLPAWAAEPKVKTPPYNTLTEEEEIALGRKFSREYERHVQLLDNPIIGLYLENVVKKLADASQRPNLQYQVKVVNTAEINACAIPGGFVYVQRGFLEFVEDENEMVGALAHEVGHVVARHTTNQLMLSFLARNLYETVKKNILLDNNVIAGIIEQFGGPLVMLAQLKYSRENESEADLLGFYEMARAGWHPEGLARFFTRVQRLEGDQTLVDVLLSDHPPSSDRVEAVEKELDLVKITAPVRQTPLQFRALKTTLSLLPPAPKPARPKK